MAFQIDVSKCILCGACVATCPSDAIGEVVGSTVAYVPEWQVDKLLGAAESLGDLVAPLSRVTGGDDGVWEEAVRRIRAVIDEIKEARDG